MTTELYIFREKGNVYISTNKPYYDEAMGYMWEWDCGADYDTIRHVSIFKDLEEGVLYKWSGNVEPIENKGK